MVAENVYESSSFVSVTFVQQDLEEIGELSEMRDNVMGHVVNAMRQAQEYQANFDQYSYLWVDDRDEFMQQFLMYGHVITPEEIEAHGEDHVPKCPPTLQMFNETHKNMSALEKEMESLSVSAGLFEVNVPDYKQLKACRKEIILLKELWDMIYLMKIRCKTELDMAVSFQRLFHTADLRQTLHQEQEQSGFLLTHKIKKELTSLETLAAVH
ncbi:UNVERIFIED_CONTAM: hypothetical protein FKN15_038496 [Acipenser sinensis]